jgi:hypothetical protein
MRLVAFTSLLVSTLVFAAPQRDPTAAYAQRVQATLTQIAMQLIQSNPQLLQGGGSVWLTCRIGPSGNVQKVDLVSRHRVLGISEGFCRCTEVSEVSTNTQRSNETAWRELSRRENSHWN